ncbi:hypothetical protein QWY85_01690 [Neolewinella lacunae]|nr:hypothetical protein [Neolewinella lacunae]MDN3633350.1 hypothetical protein [Neolewinella lacunae]
MQAIIDLLSPELIDAIVATYGSVADWYASIGSPQSIVVDDLML